MLTGGRGELRGGALTAAVGSVERTMAAFS